MSLPCTNILVATIVGTVQYGTLAAYGYLNLTHYLIIILKQ